jgi:hypothetical protein
MLHQTKMFCIVSMIFVHQITAPMPDRELPADVMLIITIAAAIPYVIPYTGSFLWGVMLTIAWSRV